MRKKLCTAVSVRWPQAQHLQTNLLVHTKTTFVRCTVASPQLPQNFSNRRMYSTHAYTHTHTCNGRLLLRTVREADLYHKTCSLLRLLTFNLCIYVKAPMGRTGLMGGHWMLLSQVSRFFMIAHSKIRRMGGDHFPSIISIFCGRCRGQLVTQMAGVPLKTFQGETIISTGRVQGLQCQLLL